MKSTRQRLHLEKYNRPDVKCRGSESDLYKSIVKFHHDGIDVMSDVSKEMGSWCIRAKLQTGPGSLLSVQLLLFAKKEDSLAKSSALARYVSVF